MRRSDHTEADRIALIEALRHEVAPQPRQIIAGIWPLPGEADLRPLWRDLHADGHAIVMPETPPAGQALRFRDWHPECPMLTGRWGTQYPDCGLSKSPPGLLFVPLLAFDRDGYRLGHGGGYYDRTLAAFPVARAIGYGFSVQQVDAVPRGPFDLKLEVIVTERGRARLERE